MNLVTAVCAVVAASCAWERCWHPVDSLAASLCRQIRRETVPSIACSAGMVLFASYSLGRLSGSSWTRFFSRIREAGAFTSL